MGSSSTLLVDPVTKSVVGASAPTAPAAPGSSRCLGAAVTWGVILAVVTEVLSGFRLLSLGPILTAWVVIAVASLAWARRPPTAVRPALELPWTWRLLLAAVVLLAGVIGVSAVVAPPNDGDSLAYHMSRVMFWQQNRTVAHYPTSVRQQLSSAPWAEYVILHLQILSGGDRLANLVQWLAMLGSLLGVWLIARELGASPRGQVLAVVLTATLPMGILQASTAQNDYVLSFWLVCVAYYALRLRSDRSWPTALAFGGAVGLALLTKGTAYFFLAPLIVLAAWNVLRPVSGVVFLRLAAAMVLALAVNLGFFWRNAAIYHTPLGDPDITQEVSVRQPSAAVLASNAMRNLSLHAAVPFIGPYTKLEQAVRWLHHQVGLDPDDPNSTYEPQRYHYHLPTYPFSEYYQGNPLHLYLAVLLLGGWLIFGRWVGMPAVVRYGLCLLAGFALFCLLLRWQPTGSRLQLLLFVLGAPVLATLLDRRLPPRWNWGIAAIFLLSAVPVLVLAQNRRLVGDRNIWQTSRLDQYFADNRDLRQPYREATQDAARGGSSGIGLDGDFCDYLLWVLLHAQRPGARIEYVVTDADELSQPRANALWVHLPFPAGEPFEPDVILSTRAHGPTLCYGSVRYERARTEPTLTVYHRLSKRPPESRASGEERP